MPRILTEAEYRAAIAEMERLEEERIARLALAAVEETRGEPMIEFDSTDDLIAYLTRTVH